MSIIDIVRRTIPLRACRPVALMPCVALLSGMASVARAEVREFQPRVRWGGYTRQVAVDPFIPAIAYAATETGGVFKTADGGVTWRHLDGLPPHRMFDIQVSPRNDNVLVASVWMDSLTRPGHIWRSTDAGATWQRPPGSAAAAQGGCDPLGFAWGAAFAPDEASLYVGTHCGIAVSRDDGATWQHVRIDPTLAGGLVSVQSIVARAGGIVDVCASDGPHRSTDRGLSWSPVPAGSPIRGCQWHANAAAGSPFETNVLFMVWDRLYESDDGGQTWTALANLGGSRPAFVVAHPSRSLQPGAFDLYFGDGFRLFRQTCATAAGAAPRCRASVPAPTPGNPDPWEALALDHGDPSDVAFSTFSRCPQFMASDGGVHRSADCGGSWRITGVNGNGFNALQVYDVFAQVHPDHSDLYFGTQDNELFASDENWRNATDVPNWVRSIGAEGFFLQAPRNTASHDDQVITFRACFGCSNRMSDAHFSNERAWPNAPTTPGTDPGIPRLLQMKEYVQFNDAGIHYTFNAGNSWSNVGLQREPLVGFMAQASGPVADPMAIVPASRADGSFGLRRVNRLREGRARVVGIDGSGAQRLINLGGFCNSFGTFVCPLVFGVNPGDVRQLIAVDVGDGTMKMTRDGGNSWISNLQLTQLVTDSGERRFVYGDGLIGTQAHVVAFDPADPRRILVGTDAAGILASVDGGDTWTKLVGSEAVTGVTSFAFDEGRDTILVSTYGRGLWQVHLPAPSDRRLSAAEYTGPTRAHFGAGVNLAGQVRDVATGALLRGARLRFFLGSQSCTALTSAGGTAACNVGVEDGPGTLTARVEFAGDAEYAASTGASDFVVEPAPQRAPVITSITPEVIPRGRIVTVRGTDFGLSQNTSILTFNGLAATPSSWQDGMLVAPVPADVAAGKVGVVVAVAGRISNTFTMEATAGAPVISSLSPASAARGARVVVSGSSFGSKQAGSFVQFGGIATVVQSWSDTRIVAEVPSNSPPGALSVFVNVGLVKGNAVPFTVTP